MNQLLTIIRKFPNPLSPLVSSKPCEDFLCPHSLKEYNDDKLRFCSIQLLFLRSSSRHSLQCHLSTTYNAVHKCWCLAYIEKSSKLLTHIHLLFKDDMKFLTFNKLQLKRNCTFYLINTDINIHYSSESSADCVQILAPVIILFSVYEFDVLIELQCCTVSGIKSSHQIWFLTDISFIFLPVQMS